MWVMSRSHFFTSRSKIYKCGNIFKCTTYRSHYGLFLQSNILPNASDYLWINLLVLFSGIAITGIGGGMYVAAGIGAGPRDGFMLTISDKTGLSISRARIIVECIVLVIGFMLGVLFYRNFSVYLYSKSNLSAII